MFIIIIVGNSAESEMVLILLVFSGIGPEVGAQWEDGSTQIIILVIVLIIMIVMIMIIIIIVMIIFIIMIVMIMIIFVIIMGLKLVHSGRIGSTQIIIIGKSEGNGL